MSDKDYIHQLEQQDSALRNKIEILSRQKEESDTRLSYIFNKHKIPRYEMAICGLGNRGQGSVCFRTDCYYTLVYDYCKVVKSLIQNDDYYKKGAVIISRKALWDTSNLQEWCFWIDEEKEQQIVFQIHTDIDRIRNQDVYKVDEQNGKPRKNTVELVDMVVKYLIKKYI